MADRGVYDRLKDERRDGDIEDYINAGITMGDILYGFQLVMTSFWKLIRRYPARIFPMLLVGIIFILLSLVAYTEYNHRDDLYPRSTPTVTATPTSTRTPRPSGTPTPTDVPTASPAPTDNPMLAFLGVRQEYLIENGQSIIFIGTQHRAPMRLQVSGRERCDEMDEHLNLTLMEADGTVHVGVLDEDRCGKVLTVPEMLGTPTGLTLRIHHTLPVLEGSETPTFDIIIDQSAWARK